MSAGKQADPAYVSWLHSKWKCWTWYLIDSDEPVNAYGMVSTMCEGRVEQSHLRDMTGVGRKEPDRNSVPMCHSHHVAWEQHKGPFKGWTKTQRREAFRGWVAECHDAYASDGGVLA